MLTSIGNRKVIVANQQPSVLKYIVATPTGGGNNNNNDNNDNNNNYIKNQAIIEDIEAMNVHEINRMLAHEFIESRLDIPASEENVEKFANLISELEAQ